MRNRREGTAILWWRKVGRVPRRVAGDAQSMTRLMAIYAIHEE